MVRRWLASLALFAPILLAAGCLRSVEEPRELRPSNAGALVVPHWEVAHQSRAVLALAMRPDGSEGWAVGEEGLVVHYDGHGWKEDKKASALAKSDLKSIWLSADGRSGWIASLEGEVLRLRNGLWEPAPRVPGLEGDSNQRLAFVSIAAGADGTKPCVVDLTELALWCLENRSFHLAASLSEARGGFRAVAWTAGGKPAWALAHGREEQEGKLSYFIEAFRYAEGGWQAPVRIPLLQRHSVTDAWMASDQSEGWAVGNGGLLLRYQDERWTQAPGSGVLTDKDLVEIAMAEDGSRGWAASTSGTVLAFDGKSWRVASGPAELMGGLSLSALWLEGNGQRGWAFDRTGKAFLLQEGVWQPQSGSLFLTLAYLEEVWCDSRPGAWAHSGSGGEIFHHEREWKVVEVIPPSSAEVRAVSRNGSVGWAARRKHLLHYRDKAWRPWTGNDPLADSKVEALALSPAGDSGLLWREDGALYRFRQGYWSLDREAGDRLGKVNNLWLMPGSLTGWANGDSNRLLFLRDGVWTGEPSSLPEPETELYEVFSSADGEGSVGFDGEGQAFRFSGGAWDPAPDFPTFGEEEQVGGIWLGDRRSGWMVTTQGNVWALFEGRWLKDRQASGLVPGKQLSSVCLGPDGRSGWAVGTQGIILKYAPKEIQAARLLPEKGAALAELRGRYILSFPWDVQKDELPEVRLLGGDGTESTLGYQIQPMKGGLRTFRLTFTEPAEEFAKREEGRFHQIRVRVRLAHASLPVVAILESEPILLHGLNLWQKTLLGAFGVVGLNLLLFVSATRSRWLRSMVLHPVGSAALGLVVGKYLLTDWLIRFVLPLKLAMFRDYRQALATSPVVKDWSGRTYISPDISLEEETQAQTQGEEAWQSVFRQLLGQPKNRLWLVVGPSGLGKTALLEKWTGLALALGKTPFLIRLRSNETPQEEATALMGQYGYIDVKPECAQDLLTGGGFVLLLDGYNEDRNPGATREFIRQAARRNLVILTSQFDPGWEKILDVRAIHLKPFGRDQLRQILSEEWVDRVLSSPYLEEVARLPFTAKLLARFVNRNGELPRTELEVYEDLRTGLDPSSLLNLEAAAWEMFKSNDRELGTGTRLSPEFLDGAVAAGILTRRTMQGKESYRFVHDRVHRLFVAAYLERQDERSLEEWYKEVSPGLGRGYWTDVLDFWGQIKGRLATQGGEPDRKAYRLFLRKVAAFHLRIFRERLYVQYDRLSQRFAELDDPEFVRWAARVLVGADPETHNESSKPSV